MRILVTFAVAAEFAPWRKRHDFSLVQLADLRTYQAEITWASVVVLLTGMGGARASHTSHDAHNAATRQPDFTHTVYDALSYTLPPTASPRSRCPTTVV